MRLKHLSTIGPRIFSGAFLLSILILLAANPADAKGPGSKSAGKTEVWTLDQISEEAGRGQLIVSQKGVRIKLKSLTAILTAPKFDAIIFDTSTKKFVELPFKVWSEKYKDTKKTDVKPTAKTQKIAGLNAVCYNVYSRVLVKEVWFTNDLDISADMLNFITTTMHLPGGKGLPIRMDVSRHGVKERVFDTLKLVKSDKLDPKIFERPTGFKRVNSEYQLFVKEDTLKDMGGFLQ